MLYYAYYVIRPRDELRDHADLDSELRSILSEPIGFRNPQGGRTAWRLPDYRVLVKLFFLAGMRKRYGGPFLCEAPHSEAFFDQWWVLETLREGLDREEMADDLDRGDFQSVDSGNNPLINSYFEGFPFRQGGDPELPLNREYRVIYKNDVVGWLRQPECENDGTVQGVWAGTINVAGKEFSRSKVDSNEYEVILEGPTNIRGRLSLVGDKALFKFSSGWL